MAVTGKKQSEAPTADQDDVKRQKISSASVDGTKNDETPQKIDNDYQGFSFQDPGHPLKVDTIEGTETAPAFFKEYVSQRKPCLVHSLPTLLEHKKDGECSSTAIQITRKLLEEVAGDKTIQVEKRNHLEENFGQNRTSERQVLLTISEFLEKLHGQTNDKEGELFYWSTQEDTDDPFNVPCRQLVDLHKIPSHLSHAGNLILSSCNLWMGQASQGASSGLHHDYHDNFYLLLRGRKRFRLFSPDCAPNLSTHGKIERIHPNGRISYVGNEARADGVPMADLLDNNNDGDIGESSDDDDDEEEIVLGKGFDYVSDSDEEGFDEANQKDDFDEIMMGAENDGPSIGSKKDLKNDKKDDEPPDGFSKINPCRSDTEALKKEFPHFASCREVMVEVKAGQMLYLPAGWFHEVTSYSVPDKDDYDNDDLQHCHMALNYWYHPPDALDNFNNPYQDDFWKKEELSRLEVENESKAG